MSDNGEKVDNKLMALEEKTRNKLEKLNDEIVVRDNKIEQLTNDLNQIKSIVSSASTSEKLIEVIKENKAKIDTLQNENRRYLLVIKRIEGEKKELKEELKTFRQITQQLQ